MRTVAGARRAAFRRPRASWAEKIQNSPARRWWMRWQRSCAPPRKNKKFMVAITAADGAVNPRPDLQPQAGAAVADALLHHGIQRGIAHDAPLAHLARSEERRVGKECR